MVLGLFLFVILVVEVEVEVLGGGCGCGQWWLVAMTVGWVCSGFKRRQRKREEEMRFRI